MSQTPTIAFQLAADASYARMTIAMVNAILHFHPDSHIRLYTPDGDRNAFNAVSGRVEFVTPPPAQFQFGEFHPLIWTKMESAAWQGPDVVVVLDVDQIMYRSIRPLGERFWTSGADFGSGTDDEDVRHQFRILPDILKPVQDRPGVSSGTMFIRPSLELYKNMRECAELYSEHAKYPDQSVLNVLAYVTGRWMFFGEELQMYHFSPSILKESHGSCLIHFYTPRPACFEANPKRAKESTFAEACADFILRCGHPYPEARIERDFMLRLHNKLGIVPPLSAGDH